MKPLMMTLLAAAAMMLAACTPDRPGEMGRVDAESAMQPPPEGVSPEQVLRDALEACRDVIPAVSREQCEAEARRAYEGMVDTAHDETPEPYAPDNE
jgi:hypothetical protein